MYSTLNVESKIKNYSIEFLTSLDEILKLINEENTITFIDANVHDLYHEFYGLNVNIVNCTEDEKTLIGAENIYSILISKKANIKTKLVVIGGGILQDLVGFCASTYCRGIDYILVPTTLLAQADSCVGGKTSINYKNKKNILGTFYPPDKILIYPNFTKTLSNSDLLSGFGEIYKFYILQNKINNFNINSNLIEMIHNGLEFKLDILSRDEFDRGERKFLNFGHTFGHALESSSGYKIPHGISVILGCMIACSLSRQFGYNVPDYDLIIERGIYLIRKSKINFKKEWFDFYNLLEIAKSDKKSTGKLTMVLIDGKPFLREVKEYDILSETIKEIYESI